MEADVSKRETPKVEAFYCFDPSTPLWVGKKPDLTLLQKGGTPLEDIMSGQVCRFDGDGFCVVFCKDGLCMVRIDTLDEEMQDIRENENAPLINQEEKRRLSERWLSLHRQYVHYLNAIQLLVDSALLQVDLFAFLHSATLRLSDVFPVIIDETRLMPVVDYSGTESFHATRDKLRKGRRLWDY
ncbi:MAG: hypothetical protein IH899_02535, partial [Planctomycetes bacterium]|nr:hypothetical protein [Planctomycetota bacterium]